MGDMIALILSSRPARWILAALAFLGVLAVARRDAARDAITEAQNDEARRYVSKRKEIDNADLGIGGTDAGRIERLRAIADRNRGGGD